MKWMLWGGFCLLPLTLAGAWALSGIESVEPPPEVSLGVMRSCARMGELSRRVAEDRDAKVKLGRARYREYQSELASSQALFDSPRFSVLLPYRFRDLEAAAIKNLGVQICISAYYGFKDAEHARALHKLARSCQDDSHNEADLNACMGDQYQETLSSWWDRSDTRG